MALKDSIIDKIVKPQSDNKFDNVIARVIDYDKTTNTAKIAFKNPKNVGIMELENVPSFLHKGVVTPNLQPGDSVYVMFVNGSIMQPYITGVLEKGYVYNTRLKERHRRKGSYITDNVYSDTELIKYNDKSGVDSWIDDTNGDITKYYTHAKNEPISDCILDINSIGFFEDGEVGMYHPEISSIVKLKNNGSIDIFTSSNVGIRINPNEKSIRFFSDNLNFNCDKWYIESDEFNFKGKNFNIDADTINLKGREVNIEKESEDI